jgi:hypothetical protein
MKMAAVVFAETLARGLYPKATFLDVTTDFYTAFSLRRNNGTLYFEDILGKIAYVFGRLVVSVCGTEFKLN